MNKKSGKTIAEMRAENPNFDRDLERTFHMAEKAKVPDIASLVAEHQKIRSHIDQQSKLFSDYCKPYNEQMAALQAQITSAMTEQGIKSLKTDTGTAILSEINTAKIKPDERDAYIDFCMEHWQEIGGEMLVVGAPKAEAVRNYMDAHGGDLPPHIEMSTILRFSIRKA